MTPVLRPDGTIRFRINETYVKFIPFEDQDVPDFFEENIEGFLYDWINNELAIFHRFGTEKIKGEMTIVGHGERCVDWIFKIEEKHNA